MQAVLVVEGAPGRLALQEAAEPQPGPHEALVEVHAISLNLGEVRRTTVAPAGWRPGWDVAGVVLRAAENGKGPPAGARVAGLLVDSGGWAERVAVPTNALAALPESVSFELAATLPIAGLTALYALARGGLLLGKRVLITGASGGVGIFATQLARAAGADASGLVRSERHAGIVGDAGARHVLSGEGASLEGTGPYDLILDSVGGDVFAKALDELADEGQLVTFGTSQAKTAAIALDRFYSNGGRRIYGFIIFHEVLAQPASVGLARLATLVAEGVLRPHVAARYPFAQIGKAVGDLWNRRVPGKAVVLLR
ncbi:MAG: zinc-binding dehydrogenase [Vulcanimicrobiaceae bacterium]